ncbi:hypothetical protein GGI23_007436, partial [Coemansia sp. RSA 2559]
GFGGAHASGLWYPRLSSLSSSFTARTGSWRSSGACAGSLKAAPEPVSLALPALLMATLRLLTKRLLASAPQENATGPPC